MARATRTIDWRTAGLIVGAALLGAAWAAWNLFQVGGSGQMGASSSLVWAVFATPFFTFLGWVVARRREAWLAAFVCFCIYFFGVLLAARLERLFLDETTAAAMFHALYFRLTLLVQTVACVVAGAQRAVTHGTMTSSTEI